jgi:hypothetical protein
MIGIANRIASGTDQSMIAARFVASPNQLYDIRRLDLERVAQKVVRVSSMVT